MPSAKLSLSPALTILALIAIFTAPLFAQTVVESNLPGAGFDEPTSNVPTIQVFSRETIVDVLVSDDKGQPVRGLRRSDFTIEEEGHPQPIRSFSEVNRNVPPPPPAVQPPNTFSNAHNLPAIGPVQIFYFDIPCAASYPPGSDPVADTAAGQIVVRAKKYIADYFRTMPAGTQVALFAYRCDYGLRLLQGFTTDGQRVAAAIDNLIILSVGPGPKFDPIAAAGQIAAYVAGVHGRKNLIWIGSPLNVMRDGGQSWSKSPDMIIVHRLMDTYDRFTREQIAIYPFDPVGVPAPGLFSNRQSPALGGNTLRVEDIATETGGVAIYNTNDFKAAAAKIVDDASHYYTLSYVPPRPNDDDHFHPLKISVDRPDIHLVYRDGYNDEQTHPPDAVLKVQMTQASMGLGALPSTQLLFTLQVTPSPTSDQRTGPLPNRGAGRRALPIAAGKTNVAYDLLFKLDQTQISFSVAKDGTHTASLEFDLAAYNSDGKQITVRSQTLKLPLTPAEYFDFIQIPFQFYLSVDLPPGPVTLRAGVFDDISSRAGTIEIPLTVASR